MEETLLGLYQLLSFEERQEIERELSLSFADLFDQLDSLHFEVRELERLLNRIFRGERHKEVDW
jgi:hypothetical protein